LHEFATFSFRMHGKVFRNQLDSKNQSLRGNVFSNWVPTNAYMSQYIRITRIIFLNIINQMDFEIET
jgi:hypothetical protein